MALSVLSLERVRILVASLFAQSTLSGSLSALVCLSIFVYILLLQAFKVIKACFEIS